jgi:hypothetical protein
MGSFCLTVDFGGLFGKLWATFPTIPRASGVQTTLEETLSMRALNEYGLADWMRGTPLEHLYKRARDIVFDRLFCGLRPRGFREFLGRHAHLTGGTVAFTIAYNTPWVINLLTRSVRDRLVFDAFIVLDNSNQPDAPAEIEQVCRGRGVSYLGLPSNPSRGGSGSHGNALNGNADRSCRRHPACGTRH